MGDLHSIVYFDNINQSSSQASDALTESCTGDSPPSILYSTMDDSGVSNCYLEDVLLNSKPRRPCLSSLPHYHHLIQTDDHQYYPNYHPNLMQCYWSTYSHAENSHLNVVDDYQLTGGKIYMGTSRIINEVMKREDITIQNDDDTTLVAEEGMIGDSNYSSWPSPTKTPLELASNNSTTPFISDKEQQSSIHHAFPGGSRIRKKKVMKSRVVYPFAVVKPGGLEGDITLNDINESILTRPRRPIKHPVGDFACHPLVSLDGPGLSGKSLVALTRIKTRGRGTITIIRTKD